MFYKIIVFYIIFTLIVSNTFSQSFTKVINDPCVNSTTQSYGSSFIDFDDDGDLDLYVANFTSSTNELFINNGSGNFTINNSLTITNTNGSSLGHSWIDFDKDCDLDLFISNGGVNGSQTNQLFINNGPNFNIATTAIFPATSNNSQTSNWGDFDNDGDLDLFICNMASQNNYFLINNNGILSLNTSSIISTNGGTSNDANWVDYDNDGDLDLFVANSNNEKNFLYKNNGNASFTKIITGNIVNDYGTSIGACWGDYNNDGFLDLYVCNAYESNFLYKNNGNGTFTKITTGDLVTDNIYSYGASWIDYDNDGDLDLHVTNSNNQNNKLYKNNGDGTFTSITSGSIVNDGGYSRSSTWADIDHDGDLDCYVTNRSYVNNCLYINQTSPQNHWINIKLKGITSNYDAIGCVVKIKATINGNSIWQMRHISSKAGYCSQESPEVEFGLGNANVIDSIVIYWPTSNTNCIYTNVTSNQFISYYETCTNYNYFSLYDTICKGANYTINSDGNIYNWYSDSIGTTVISTDSIFNFSNLNNDTIIYFKNPNYNCSIKNNSFHITTLGTSFSVDLGSDTSLCNNDSIVINLPFQKSSIMWQDGSNDSLYTIDKAGTYHVTIDSAGCIENDTIKIDIIPTPIAQTPQYHDICNRESIELIAESGFNYYWSNGNTAQSIIVSDSNDYYVSTYNQCDTVQNDFHISMHNCSCMLVVPSAFSPNGDGVNDYFYPYISCTFEEYHLYIYNRWGELLYKTNNQGDKWDGSFNGKEVPVGVYIYYINYKQPYIDHGSQRTGSITILR